MKTYDLIFSLGSSCGTSQALRAAGLQYASFPLDWVGVPEIGLSAQSVVTDFTDWFEAKDLDLYTVCHTVGFMTRLYLHRRTRMIFSHEFSDFLPFAKTYPKVRATYERRIARFNRDFASAGRILAVWAELATHGAPSFDVYRRALADLRAKRPDGEVDLLCFVEDPEAKEPRTVLEEDGLTVVAADYREMDGTFVAHYQNWSQFVKTFKTLGLHVPDPRTDDEKRRHEQGDKDVGKLKWGPDKTPFRRWLNKHAYKTFRTLEGHLQRKGFVQKDISFWCWPEIRREAERGGAK